MSVLNQDRAKYHLTSLQPDYELMDIAQAWSAKLAAAGKLTHSHLGHGVHGCFRKLGENVGYAHSVGGVEQAFIADIGVNPPVHRINIKDSAFDRVGMGVTYKNGNYWVVQVFRDSC